MKNTDKHSRSKIKILIADDHRLLRESWKAVLGNDPRFQIVGLASDGNEIVSMASGIEYDIILMDLNMKPVNGFDATAEIIRTNPAARIIAVSMNTAPEYIRKIVKLGVVGYINKNSGTEEFLDSIERVHEGKKYFCRETMNILAERFIMKENAGDKDLTPREISVITMIKLGLTSVEMAAELGIAGKTVEVHRYNILRKLKVRNVAGVINVANELGIG